MEKTIKCVIISLVIAAAGGVLYVGSNANQPSKKDVITDTTQQKEPEERTVTETKKEAIKFETKTVKDNTVEYGKTVVKTEGKNGEKTYTYSVKYKGEKELSRKLVKEEVTRKPVNKIIAKGTKIIWRCVDATSYNKNPYDDNRCTSSTGEVRYVSDSQSRALDPSYTPGNYGHPYYNSK